MDMTMTGITTITSTVTASFLASFVEVAEAFTIILAVGLARGWRPALTGTVLALLLLGALILLLILFGMRWLRKAILRAAGFIGLHDEEKAFAAEKDLLARQATDRRADFLAGTAAFKAVLLEGVEVVFIVIAVGTGRGLLGYASLGAVAACLLVLAIGFLVHRPLSRVPENTLKFVVGVM